MDRARLPSEPGTVQTGAYTAGRVECAIDARRAAGPPGQRQMCCPTPQALFGCRGPDSSNAGGPLK
eukprot:589473-Alexandrium_andersonii.AAC.1